MLADANLFAESAGGPTTHSDRRPNEEGQSAVLISMWTHIDVPAKFSIDELPF